jgi:peptide/nickel transport system permease protein
MKPPPENPTAGDAAAASRLRARLRTGGRALRRRGRLAAGLLIVVAFYAAALFATFLAPYGPHEQSRDEPSAPASVLRFFDAEGRFHPRPFVYARRLTDPLSHAYAEDASRRYPLALFVRGSTHRLLGLFETDRHLFGVAADDADGRRSHRPRVSLLGTDELGRDRLSRLLLASRFSLLVGPLGTLLASLVGVLVGCVSGYSGRRVDAVLMRAADAMMALPALVLILAARAAFPPELPPGRAATLIISLFVALGWAEMARLARGLVMELRGREFVVAARSLGMTEARVLFRHVLPNASRPLVVQASLMLPAFLLAETALSYLGVGVQDPAASWGNMLEKAATLAHLRERPLLLLSPAFAISLFVLGVRLLSDGLKGGGAAE